MKKRFGNLSAVDGVSIEVQKGEVVGLVGPNGSGKSTLFNLIAGLYKPDGGQIFLDDEKIDGLSPNKIFKKGLVRTFQVPRLFSGMTIMENLLVSPPNQKGEKLRFAPVHRTWEEQELSLATQTVSLSESLEIGGILRNSSLEISGGQMKLSELARGITGSPKILLLDEPTAGVFPKLALEIFDRIKMLRQNFGTTFLIIEHRLNLLFDFVDRVYIMHEGKIIAEGPKEEILKSDKVREVYLGHWKK